MTGTEPHAWETGLMENITYIGLDVHKATVCVALAENGRGGEVLQIGVFENRSEILVKLAARLSKGGRRLSFCYEAGPCGYGLHRLLTGCGHDCVVVMVASGRPGFGVRATLRWSKPDSNSRSHLRLLCCVRRTVSPKTAIIVWAAR